MCRQLNSRPCTIVSTSPLRPREPKPSSLYRTQGNSVGRPAVPFGEGGFRSSLLTSQAIGRTCALDGGALNRDGFLLGTGRWHLASLAIAQDDSAKLRQSVLAG